MPTPDFKQATTLLGKILASGCVNPDYVVSFAGSPTAGTFTVTLTTGYNGPTPNVQSATITYSTGLTAASVQTAIQALTGMSTVTVTGSAGGPYTITIPPALGVGIITVSGSLTGGTAPTPQLATTGRDATIYTVPASSAVKIATAAATNAVLLPATLIASVVPSGGALDGTHRVLSNYSLAASDTITQQDVLSALSGAFLDAAAFLSLNTTQPLTYLLTGAVSA